jgi:hypothetical protein
MNIFNLNAFYLGTILILLLFLTILFYSLICIIWEIRITAFVILFDPWFSIFSTKIDKTKYSLGWLPLGCYIKVLGSRKEDFLKDEIKEDDIPFTLLNKSNRQQQIFKLVPYLGYILIIIICLYLIDNSHNPIKAVKDLFNYLIETLKCLVSNKTYRPEFISKTQQILVGKSVISFSILLFFGFMALFYPLIAILGWSTNEKVGRSFVLRVLLWIISVAILYIVLWMVPKFVFSFFTFAQILKYILSFLIGLFLSGITLYFITIWAVKLRNMLID